MPAKSKASFLKQPYFVSISVALFLFLFHLFHLIDFHELDAIDLRFKLRGQMKAHPKIVLLEIDDASMAAVGQWPWPRSIHAALLDILARYEPRLVFFDILFTEAGPKPEDDAQLAEAVKRLGKVILPFYFYSEKPFGAFFPLEGLHQAAWNTGFVNVEPDRDGISRRFRAWIQTEQGIYYHPAILAMFSDMPSTEEAQKWFHRLPIDRRGQLWIHYPGPITAFHRIPFWKVIDAVGGERDGELRELLKDSIVLIGQTATGTTDLKATPFTPTDPGMAVQASAIHTLLTKRFLYEAPFWFILGILVLMAAGVDFLTHRFSPKKSLLYCGTLILIYTALNLGLFYSIGLILPLFLPPAVIVVTYAFILFMKHLEARFAEELITRELTTAARIQENFLPAANPSLEGLDIAFACRFIKQVGGDLFDWAEFSQGRLGVCVGDVSGKGVPAALYMAKAMSEFRRDRKDHILPGQAQSLLNDRLAQSGMSGMFLTLFYATLDLKEKKLWFSSAGHDPMILYRKSLGKTELHTEAQGTPLGLFEGTEYETAEVAFNTGDMMVVVTDGIKELRSNNGEEFGMERLRLLVESLAVKNLSAKDTIEALFGALQEFQKGAEPHDDRTVLCVKF